MKPKSPSIFDFRMQISSEVDLVLTARARALGLDKAAVAREVLTRWAHEESAFCEALQQERENNDKREIRLVAKRKSVSRRVQNAVFARDGFKCRQCGAEPGPSMLHIDHVIPVNAGGDNNIGNLQVLCRPCNLEKADKVVSLESAQARSGRK